MTSSSSDGGRRASAPTRLRRYLSASDRQDTRLAHLYESLRTGLWFVPGLFVTGAVVMAAATITIDRRVDGIPTWLTFRGAPESAQQILATTATAMLTFTGLVFTITVVVLQLASSQFSPRVLRTFLRDRGSQVPLGIFTATFVFALIVLVQVRIGDAGPKFVPGLSITVSYGLVLISLAAFVYFVNHVAQSIRVVNIIESVANATRHAIDSSYPDDHVDDAAPTSEPDLGEPSQVVRLERRAGVLAGLDIEGLIELARRHDCVLRIVRDMGDFVVEGAPIVEVFGSNDISTREVLRQVDIARERTMRQDPAYGIRQLVDIAEKALSPSLNDPTTAVQAIDRIHDLLDRIAHRSLLSSVYEDDDGEVRLVRPVMTWSGYVTLAFEEIREYGGSSIQVQRRLRAAIDELLTVVDGGRCEPLDRQVRLLDRRARREFRDAEERELATGADASGIGSVPDESTSD